MTLTDGSLVILSPYQRPNHTFTASISYIHEGGSVSLGKLIVQDRLRVDPSTRRDSLFEPEQTPINLVTIPTDQPQTWRLSIARDESSVDAHDMSIPLSILTGEFEVAKAENLEQSFPSEYVGKNTGPFEKFI